MFMCATLLCIRHVAHTPMYVQVATSHSDPEVTHRQSSPDESYDQSPRGGRGGEDEMSDIYRAYGVMARNAHKECLVCSMEVCTCDCRCCIWL